MFEWLKKKKKDEVTDETEQVIDEAVEASANLAEEAETAAEEQTAFEGSAVIEEFTSQEQQETEVSEISEPEPVAEPKSESAPEPEKKKKKPGFFAKFFSSLFETLDDDFYDELEEQLIIGDMGVYATEELLDHLKEEVQINRIRTADDARTFLMDEIKKMMALPQGAYDFENGPSVVMLIGVNGVGKTTCVGKLTKRYMDNGKKVIMAGADTFRAAAMDQLKIWAERNGCYMVSGNEGQDPGSVVYDAAQAARARGADILICDTAGRLHNKKNLMSELAKLDKILASEASGYARENLIVLDATTGQNALQQARDFGDVMKIDGIVLTKLDGTAKGGIAVAITRELGVPVKYVGMGEGINDLIRFDPNSYVEDLFAE